MRYPKYIVAAIVVALLVPLAAVEAQSLLGSGDIRNNSLTGKDVRNKSLTKQDFRGSVRGRRGATGPQGPQGPPGPSALGRKTFASSGTLVVAPGDIQTVTAVCPAGHAVISGGWTIISGAAVPFIDQTFDGVSWTVGVDNFDGLVPAEGTAQATCAPTGQAVAAKASSRRAKITAAIHAQRAAH